MLNPRRRLSASPQYGVAAEETTAEAASQPQVQHGLAVKAYYVARSIDVAQLYERSSLEGGLVQERFGRESVMLTVRNDDEWLDESSEELSPWSGHVVVFSYGSVVFFNVDASRQRACLQSFGAYCAEAIPEGFRPTEDYRVITGGEPRDPSRPRVLVRPTRVPLATRREPAMLSSAAAKSLRRRVVVSDEESTTEIRFEEVVLPRLDVHNVSVIATVMAQSVALDHYSVKVDAMLDTFTRLNSSVEKTGVFSALQKQSLFRLVALNNTLFTDVIAKIGLLERSETAWKNREYTEIWEGLRDEFEVEDRFEKIEFKLNLVQLNTKFFLEVLANQKSNTLEWIIIVLISLEIVVCSLDLCNIKPFGSS